VYALNTPPAERTDDHRERLEWLGRFDPEKFDPAKVTKALQKAFPAPKRRNTAAKKSAVKPAKAKSSLTLRLVAELPRQFQRPDFVAQWLSVPAGDPEFVLKHVRRVLVPFFPRRFRFEFHPRLAVAAVPDVPPVA
jgi:hypothetical protein